MPFVVLRELEGRAKEWVVSPKRSTAGCDSSPKSCISFYPNEDQGLGNMHPEDITCINHSVPIGIGHLECRPWDMLHDAVITA